MNRQIDFEVIKADIENAHKLDREQILELAEELVTHVEKLQKLIMEQAKIFLDTHVSIEARDMEIERLKIKLESYREDEFLRYRPMFNSKAESKHDTMTGAGAMRKSLEKEED